MPVIYKGEQSPIANQDKKKLFYPRVVLVGNVSTNQIAKEIAAQSSLSQGETKSVIDNLVDIMTRHLQNSNSVTLDGFGTFRYSMKANGKGVETRNDVSAANAKVYVRFLPAFIRNADRTVATRSLITGVRFVRVDQLAIDGEDVMPGNGSTEDGSDNTDGGNQGGTGSGGNDDDQSENPMG